jgi:hypothetical protein
MMLRAGMGANTKPLAVLELAPNEMVQAAGAGNRLVITKKLMRTHIEERESNRSV